MYLRMKARLVRMGNSRGVRIPKPLIDQIGLVDELDLRVQNGTIVIAPARDPRGGWAEGAARLVASEPEGILDPATPTDFDHDEWRW